MVGGSIVSYGFIGQPRLIINKDFYSYIHKLLQTWNNAFKIQQNNVLFLSSKNLDYSLMA